MTTNAVPMSQWPSTHEYTLPVAPGPDLVTVTIDGRELQVARGELLIKAAERHGVHLPHDSWAKNLASRHAMRSGSVVSSNTITAPEPSIDRSSPCT